MMPCSPVNDRLRLGETFNISSILKMEVVRSSETLVNM
jgi:hypothetical protein